MNLPIFLMIALFLGVIIRMSINYINIPKKSTKHDISPMGFNTVDFSGRNIKHFKEKS